MSIINWRNTALALATICCYQRWQSCTHASSSSNKIASNDPGPATARTSHDSPSPWNTTSKPPALDAPAKPITGTFHGFKLPAWVTRLAPQPGETMRAYRDRILPLAQIAIAPQRARVVRTRDDFATLDPHQRAELDAAVQEAATAIENHLTSALASGELRPATFKPMTGITIARGVLDIVDRGNTRFLNSLTPDQRTELASHRFDFADYLVFSAHWEDALHVRD